MERNGNGNGASAEGDALERLRALLRGEGGLMATLVAHEPMPSQSASPVARRRRRVSRRRDIAAGGPRAAGRREEYELLVEAIYEGYLLHYGTPRVVRVPEADLGLLAGDRLYAIGLARLVALGDTLAVAELADTITLSALAQGAGERQLADAVWAAGARAVGWGPSELHAHAKELVLRGRARRRSRRCAQALRGRSRRPESRLDILCGRCQTSAPSTSPSTRSTGACPGRSRARRSRAAGS